MKYILTLLVGLSISCKSMPSKRESEFTTSKKAYIEILSGYISEANNGMYNLSYDSMPLEIGYDTIEWILHVDDQFADTINCDNELCAKHMNYISLLNGLLSFEGSKKVTKDELELYYGKPTSYSTKFNIVKSLNYRFNTISDPDCVKSSQDVLKSEKCSLLKFHFDNQGYLSDVGSFFFYP